MKSDQLRWFRRAWYVGIASYLLLVGSVVVFVRASEEALTRRLIEQCESTNRVREIVYQNTQTAIAENAQVDPQAAASFSAGLEKLRATPYIDRDTGRVDCKAAVRH